MKFSLLMSLYDGEQSSFLNDALNSIAVGTVIPSEVIMVLDGPIRPELRHVLEEFRQKLPLTLVPLAENVGLGRALNAGLNRCTHDWVARFDTDDIQEPDRFEQQLKFLEHHKDLDLFGSGMREFSTEPSQPQASRKVPETHTEILQYAKKRNPFNHVTVMFRKSAVLEVGGYPQANLYEDYALWVRMLMAGCTTANMQEPLVRARTGLEMYRRRGGFQYAKTEMEAQLDFYKIGFISGSRLFLNSVQRLPVRLLPSTLREKIYTRLLR